MSNENLRSIKYWGASTSAHQVEGGNHNQWSVWELENAADMAKEAPDKYSHWLPRWEDFKEEASRPENYVSGVAADHYNRYEEDFDILSSLNMNAYRFSIEWSRIEPEEGKWDDEEIEHYRKYLKELKKRRIEPFVSLWHWSMPVWFTDMGAFEKRSNTKYFVRFAEKITEELGDLFKYVVILNEPNVYMGMSYNDGIFPPQKKNVALGMIVYENLVSAHKKAYKSLKAINNDLELGSTSNLSFIYLGKQSFTAKAGAWVQKKFWNQWFLDRTKSTSDFVGLNYYFSDRWTGGMRPDNPNNKTSDLGFDMQPENIQFVIEDLHARYGKPIYILENGVADKDDIHRKWWIEETLGAMNRAIGNGADIGGYLYWSLLDNFEWADGYWPRFGLVQVDRKTLARTVRPSAKWFAQQIESIR